MWNCGGSRSSAVMRPPPRPTWTNTASSAAIVNHHRARLRSEGRRWAPSAQRPARPLPMMTNQAQPVWRSRRTSALATLGPDGELGRSGLAGRLADGGGAGLGLSVGLGGDVHQLLDLLGGEAGERTELAGQVDGALLVLAAEATEAEELVHRALELQGRLLALRVLGGDAAQPVR